MFDVGFLEILTIGVVSLVVIGPERLPAVARTIGRWVAKMQRFVRGVKADFNSELNSGDLGKLLGDQKKQIAELRKMVDDTRKDISTGADGVMQGVQKTAGDLKSAIDATRLEEDQEANSATSATGKPASSGSSLKSAFQENDSAKVDDSVVAEASGPARQKQTGVASQQDRPGKITPQFANERIVNGSAKPVPDSETAASEPSSDPGSPRRSA